VRVPRELVLILVVLTVAAAATQQAASERAGPQPPNLSSDSAAPGGARALYLWLQSLGYRVERLEYRAFRPDDATKVLLILAPARRPGEDDLSALRAWVQRGGTLIIAGAAPTVPLSPLNRLLPGGDALDALLTTFHLALKPLDAPQEEAAPSQPLLMWPAVTSVRVEATSYIAGPAGLVPYLGNPEYPTAAGLAIGQGRVYVLASAHVFSNQGLAQADNAALLLNWLPAPAAAGVLTFDEIYHGRSEARSLAYVMIREPWGWAVLYALSMVFLYLLLQGRRFGRPVPTVIDTRRVAAEYVVSLAGLLRRGGKSGWVAQHYARMLRQQLAASCGLDPALGPAAAAAWMSEVGRIATGVAGDDAGRLLLELSESANRAISEGRLVRLAAETDRIIKACRGRRP